MFHLTLYNALITMLVLAKMRLWPTRSQLDFNEKAKIGLRRDKKD